MNRPLRINRPKEGTACGQLSLVIASVRGSDDRLRAAHHLMTKLKSCVAQPQGEDLLLVTLDVPSACEGSPVAFWVWRPPATA
jgi:hypothetical protein